MKILLDFLPILLFFGASKIYDIYAGTAVLMAATMVQMALVYRMEGKLQTMHKITLSMILVFGSLTLALHNDAYIKWKPTVLYVAIAMALTVALWVYKKNFLKLFLGTQLNLPNPVWMRLNTIWIGYSVFMALTNGLAAYYLSTDAYLNFKLWGYVFPLVFVVGQGFYIAPHLKANASKAEKPTP